MGQRKVGRRRLDSKQDYSAGDKQQLRRHVMLVSHAITCIFASVVIVACQSAKRCLGASTSSMKNEAFIS